MQIELMNRIRLCREISFILLQENNCELMGKTAEAPEQILQWQKKLKTDCPQCIVDFVDWLCGHDFTGIEVHVIT